MGTSQTRGYLRLGLSFVGLVSVALVITNSLGYWEEVLRDSRVWLRRDALFLGSLEGFHSGDELDIDSVDSDLTPPNNKSNWSSIRFTKPSSLTRLPGAGMWSMDTLGKWRFSGFSNRRRTHLGFLKCLANKHILMAGDSRTRFQYLSLVLFLTHKSFPQCNEWQHSIQNVSMPLCKLSGEKGWASWNLFYQQTNQAMKTADSEEDCFCYRHADTGKYLSTHTRENRFFSMRTVYGDIKISYIQVFQDFCTLELGFPPFNQGQDVPCSVGTCSTLHNSSLILHERRINGTLKCVNAVVEGFSEGGLRQNTSSSKATPVTHVFAHSGWSDTDIGCELMEFYNRTGVPSWVLGPPSNVGHNVFIPAVETRHGCHVPYFDRATMTTGLGQLYSDGIHVTTSVNEEFNHKLLNTICGVDD